VLKPDYEVYQVDGGEPQGGEPQADGGRPRSVYEPDSGELQQDNSEYEPINYESGSDDEFLSMGISNNEIPRFGSENVKSSFIPLMLLGLGGLLALAGLLFLLWRRKRILLGKAIAWLYCPDTLIDYPVMRTNDYSYYLNHLPSGKKNEDGSLFLDYNCASDFSGPFVVIYGNHMESGKMFGSLMGYKKQSYYDEHPTMYLYTEQGNYRIELLYGFVIGAGQWRERAFMYPENVQALLAYAAHNTTLTSNAKYAENDRIVALSTCSYEFDNARYVVIGKLQRG
jgi:SrtB family sortase